MIHRFGDFTLDDDARQLLAGDDEVHLSPKAFDLLSLLLANRTRAVSKAELQERLWPATFVEETNLAGLVSEIRRALRDPASRPLLVRTVHRFGYRFVGVVTQHPAPTQAGPSRGQLYLIVDGRQFMLLEGANVVGRAPEATIAIDSPSVSRFHARILVARGEATLQDLGSKNGTHLNGGRIAGPAPLADGDEIRLGAVAMRFRISAPTSPTATLPVEG